jgi:hypothetical protein
MRDRLGADPLLRAHLKGGGDVPEYFNLGAHGRPITTASPSAQRWFNHGLTWAYAFNHEEALRCFERAIEHDPRCAVAYWGNAYAIGPNYNKAWDAFDR